MEAFAAALVAWAIINILLGCFAGAGTVGLLVLAGLAVGLIFGSSFAALAAIAYGPGLLVAACRYPAAFGYAGGAALVAGLLWMPWHPLRAHQPAQAAETARVVDVTFGGVTLAVPGDAPLQFSVLPDTGAASCRFCWSAAGLPSSARVTEIEIRAPFRNSCHPPFTSDAHAAACQLSLLLSPGERQVVRLGTFWRSVTGLHLPQHERSGIAVRALSMTAPGGGAMLVECYAEVTRREFACYGQIRWRNEVVINLSRSGDSITEAIARMMMLHAAIVTLLERYAIDATPGPFAGQQRGGTR